jgi:chromosomal replication initiation ATPase DnaA
MSKLPHIKVADCQRIVCDHFHLQTGALKSATRFRKIARPRQMAMTLAREVTDASLPAIGKMFGGRDHTTVLHARRRVCELEQTSEAVATYMAIFRDKLRCLSDERKAGSLNVTEAAMAGEIATVLLQAA